MGFRLRITSPAGVTWVDTHLMPVSRLQLAAMGANTSDLALSVGYTTASGALSNVQLAMVPFPVAAGGPEGFVKKLASLAVASGDSQKDINRTVEACKGLVNADIKPAEIEELTERATDLVRLFWRVLEMIESGSNAGTPRGPAEYNGYKIELMG